MKQSDSKMMKADTSPESALNVSMASLSKDKPEPPKTWREKLAIFMRSNAFQSAIIIMVILDSMIVVMELLVKNAILNKQTTPNEKSNSTEEDLVHEQGLAGHTLYILGVVVGTLFFIEITFKIIAEGRKILEQKAEVFDIIVVTMSFILDWVFTFLVIDTVAQDVTGLLILLRLWRISVLINGLIESFNAEIKTQLEAESGLRKKAEKQREKLTNKLKKIKEENKSLKARNRQGRPCNVDGSPRDQKNTSPPSTDPSDLDYRPRGALQALIYLEDSDAERARFKKQRRKAAPVSDSEMPSVFEGVRISSVAVDPPEPPKSKSQMMVRQTGTGGVRSCITGVS